MLKREGSVMVRRDSIVAKANDHFDRFTSRADFQQIFDVWKNSSELEGFSLSKPVVAELRKRVSSAGSKGTKSKLNFYNCSINDRKAILLIEVLALRPIIAKLDLSGNDISNESALMIQKFLKGQIRLIRSIPLDNRLDACFLGDVSLAGSSKTINPEILESIQHLSDCLRYCNAQAFIRGIYLGYNAPTQITTPLLTKLWMDAVGTKLDRTALINAFNGSGLKETTVLNYEQCEKLLLQGLIDKGSLVKLTESQLLSLLSSSRGSPSPIPTGREGNGRPSHSTSSKEQSSRDTRHDDSVVSPNRSTKSRNRDTNSSKSPGRQRTSSSPSKQRVRTESGMTNESGVSNNDSVKHRRQDSRDSRQSDESRPQSPSSVDDNTVHTYHSQQDNHNISSKKSNFDLLSMGPLLIPPPPSEIDTGLKSNRSRVDSDQYSVAESKSSEAGNYRWADHTNPVVAPSSVSPDQQSVATFSSSPSKKRVSYTVDNNQHTTLPSTNNAHYQSSPSLSSRKSSVVSNTVSDVGNMTPRSDTEQEVLPPPPLTNSASPPKMSRRASLGAYVMSAFTGGLGSSSKSPNENNKSLDMHSGGPLTSSSTDSKPSRRSSMSPFRSTPFTGNSTTSANTNANSGSRQKTSPLLSDDTQNKLEITPPKQALSFFRSFTLSPTTFKEEQVNTEDANDEYVDSGDEEVNNNATPLLNDYNQMMQSVFPRSSTSPTNNNKRENVVTPEVEVEIPPSDYIIIPPVNKLTKMTVLQLVKEKLTSNTLDFSDHLDPGQYNALKVLVLRDNDISCLVTAEASGDNTYVDDGEEEPQTATSTVGLDLYAKFRYLSNLDLSYNSLYGAITEFSLPHSLLRIDLSHNSLVDISGVVLCTQLLELNVSYNLIKRLDCLPSTVRRLNVAYNLISSATVLRNLAVCTSLISLTITGNPVVNTVSGYKAQLRSTLTKLIELDGVLLVREKLRIRNSNNKTSQQSILDEKYNKNMLIRQQNASRSAQQENDNMRSKLHKIRLQALEQSRAMYNNKLDALCEKTRKYMRPADIKDLTERLAYNQTHMHTSHTTSSNDYSAHTTPKPAHTSVTQNTTPKIEASLPSPPQLIGLSAVHGTVPGALIDSYMQIRNAANSTGTTRTSATNSEQQLSHQIQDWLTSTQSSVGRAAAVLNICIEWCTLCDVLMGPVSATSINQFKTALKRVGFYHSNTGAQSPAQPIFPLSLEYKMTTSHGKSSLSGTELKKLNTEVKEMCATVESMLFVLQHVDEALSEEHVTLPHFAATLHSILATNTEGAHVCTHILPQYGSSYAPTTSMIVAFNNMLIRETDAVNNAATSVLEKENTTKQSGTTVNANADKPARSLSRTMSAGTPKTISGVPVNKLSIQTSTNTGHQVLHGVVITPVFSGRSGGGRKETSGKAVDVSSSSEFKHKVREDASTLRPSSTKGVISTGPAAHSKSMTMGPPSEDAILARMRERVKARSISAVDVAASTKLTLGKQVSPPPSPPRGESPAVSLVLDLFSISNDGVQQNNSSHFSNRMDADTQPEDTTNNANDVTGIAESKRTKDIVAPLPPPSQSGSMQTIPLDSYNATNVNSASNMANVVTTATTVMTAKDRLLARLSNKTPEANASNDNLAGLTVDTTKTHSEPIVDASTATSGIASELNVVCNHEVETVVKQHNRYDSSPLILNTPFSLTSIDTTSSAHNIDSNTTPTTMGSDTSFDRGEMNIKNTFAYQNDQCHKYAASSETNTYSVSINNESGNDSSQFIETQHSLDYSVDDINVNNSSFVSKPTTSYYKQVLVPPQSDKSNVSSGKYSEQAGAEFNLLAAVSDNNSSHDLQLSGSSNMSSPVDVSNTSAVNTLGSNMAGNESTFSPVTVSVPVSVPPSTSLTAAIGSIPVSSMETISCETPSQPPVISETVTTPIESLLSVPRPSSVNSMNSVTLSTTSTRESLVVGTESNNGDGTVSLGAAVKVLSTKERLLARMAEKKKSAQNIESS